MKELLFKRSNSFQSMSYFFYYEKELIGCKESITVINRPESLSMLGDK